MQTNKQIENETAVGNKFLENVAPVAKGNYLTPSKKFNGVKQVTATSVTETRKFQRPKADPKAPETLLVKGFGGTPLFVLGMVTKAEATGEYVRLDSDIGKKGRLTEAEDICKWNTRMVRKLHEEEQVENNNDCCETSEDEFVPIDFPDETMASDYGTKIGSHTGKERRAK
jgi:hypothetical protein